jgi:hypothetical protein
VNDEKVMAAASVAFALNACRTWTKGDCHVLTAERPESLSAQLSICRLGCWPPNNRPASAQVFFVRSTASSGFFVFLFLSLRVSGDSTGTDLVKPLLEYLDPFSGTLGSFLLKLRHRHSAMEYRDDTRRTRSRATGPYGPPWPAEHTLWKSFASSTNVRYGTELLDNCGR